MGVGEFLTAAGFKNVAKRVALNTSNYLYITLMDASGTLFSLYLSTGLSNQVLEAYSTASEQTTTGKTLVFVDGLEVGRTFLEELNVTYTTNQFGEIRVKLGRSSEGGIDVNNLDWL